MAMPTVPPPTDTFPSEKLRAGRSRSASSSIHAPQWQTQLWQRLVVQMMIRASARVQALSPRAALRFGNGLGRFAYRVAKRQRKRAIANLHLAYGEEMTYAQREVLTRNVFQHFCRGIVSFLRTPARSTEEVAQSVSCEGWEHVETALKAGKGLLMVTGHLGNWEILGRWLAHVKHVPLTVVAREADNPALAEYMRSMRESAGFKVLSKGESARGLLRALRRGEAITILTDQSSADVFAPFFGLPTGTAAGPASLALHSGAPLVPIYCIEKPDQTFHVTCFPPVDTNATDDKDADILRITTHLNQILESVVRQHPEQWLWLHNRWKSSFQNKHRAVWSDDDTFAVAQERWKT